eukprot:4396297-Alexandrium_andersonii.AAC.1
MSFLYGFKYSPTAHDHPSTSTITASLLGMSWMPQGRIRSWKESRCAVDGLLAERRGSRLQL